LALYISIQLFGNAGILYEIQDDEIIESIHHQLVLSAVEASTRAERSRSIISLSYAVSMHEMKFI